MIENDIVRSIKEKLEESGHRVLIFTNLAIRKEFQRSYAEAFPDVPLLLQPEIDLILIEHTEGDESYPSAVEIKYFKPNNKGRLN
ncbi:MAG: hypothetical protein D6733_00790, partial [Methanobacteriota archaeon]